MICQEVFLLRINNEHGDTAIATDETLYPSRADAVKASEAFITDPKTQFVYPIRYFAFHEGDINNYTLLGKFSKIGDVLHLCSKIDSSDILESGRLVHEHLEGCLVRCTCTNGKVFYSTIISQFHKKNRTIEPPEHITALMKYIPIDEKILRDGIALMLANPDQ